MIQFAVETISVFTFVGIDKSLIQLRADSENAARTEFKEFLSTHDVKPVAGWVLQSQYLEKK